MWIYADDEIRSQSCPDCYMCGAEGELLYEGLQDRLFEASGNWNLKKCPNRDCGLVWLDPMPLEEDISKAYKTYFTHQLSNNNQWNGRLQGLFSYSLRKAWHFLLCVTPIYWERKRLNLMYLDKSRPGRLLEVGCGNGYRLAELRALGWQVEGQEVDPKAARLAGQLNDMEIYLENIENLNIRDETFDAIIMNHVIEHLHHPEDVLLKCHNLLKPGGKLIVVTPNIESICHRRFGASWRELDPPRHIHLFSCKTLLRIADKVGFSHCKSWTTAANARGVAAASFDIESTGRHIIGARPKLNIELISILILFWEAVNNAKKRTSGEECVMKAEK